jgi:peptidoglycan hydrolase-like protein with peptidoglycan-binding domain
MPRSRVVPRKTAATRSRQRQLDEDEAEGGGMVARVIDRTFENPAMTGGLLVMALTAAAIVSNALFLQGSRSGDSLFGLRSHGTDLVAGEDGARLMQQSPIRAAPPMPRLAPRAASPAPAMPNETAGLEIAPPAEISKPVASITPEPPPPIDAPRPIDQQAKLVADIQRELARVGLYNGAIDGVAGSRTTAAIEAFEVAAGLAVSGHATPELLQSLKQPLPPRTTQSIVASGANPDAEAEELNRRARERARLIEAEQRRAAELKSLEAYKVVQLALNRIGYGPLPVDGSVGVETQDAIRRFELDNGMPITGQANDALVARLVAIGAIKPG